MSRIETGLHAHHAAITGTLSTTQAPHIPQASPTGAQDNTTDPDIIETPFAKVNSVVDGSPADEAGLKAGDGIRRFGSINWVNHERLSNVAELVYQSEGVRALQISGLESLY